MQVPQRTSHLQWPPALLRRRAPQGTWHQQQHPVLPRKPTRPTSSGLELHLAQPDTQCQQEAEIIYKQKIDSEAVTLLEKAKTVWAANQNEQGANEVADIISNINPKSANYAQVESLRNNVSAKLQADAKREWDFKMKEYNDNLAYKRSLVDAAKAIGVAWGRNQPKTIYRTTIHHWW